MNPCTVTTSVCVGVIRTDVNGTWTYAIPRLIFGGIDEEGEFRIFNPLLDMCIRDASVNNPLRKLQLPNRR